MDGYKYFFNIFKFKTIFLYSIKHMKQPNEFFCQMTIALLGIQTTVDII